MKLFNKYFLITLLAFGLAACFDDPGNEIVFTAQSELEFNDSDAGSQATYEKVLDGETIADEIVVNLVGPKASNAISFTIAFDDLTTAIEGVHFELPDGLNYTIPAGSNSIGIPVIIYDDVIELDETLQLVLDLSNADIKISPNNNTVVHTFNVVCPSDIAGTYTSVANGNTPSGSYSDLTAEIVLTALGGGAYSVSDISFGLYEQIYEDTTPTGAMSDVCKVIVGAPGNKDKYGDPFTINGSLDENGVITLTWSNTFGDSGTVTLTKQ